jgi:hypothetical protein
MSTAQLEQVLLLLLLLLLLLISTLVRSYSKSMVTCSWTAAIDVDAQNARRVTFNELRLRVRRLCNQSELKLSNISSISSISSSIIIIIGLQPP